MELVNHHPKEKTRILVVEDNPLNQKLAGFLLNDLGFEFEICVNGKFAIDKLNSTKYDIVLMDIHMPELNGYQAAKYIRNVIKLDLPIIAMTAHPLPGEKEKCVEAGMTDYIVKPIQEDELLKLITNYLFPISAKFPEI